MGLPEEAQYQRDAELSQRNGVQLSTLVTSQDRPMLAASRARWSRPPVWLWAVMAAAQVAATALVTSYTYFFFDDFLFLQQARTQHFGITYLRESLFEHFSPLSRVLDAGLVHIAPGSFNLAHSVELALYAAAIGAFALVAVTIVGNRWTAFLLTVLFGQSVFLIRLLAWWTATANTLPSTVLMLLAMAGYLRWRLYGSRAWLLASLIAYAVSLLDYETAMLFPLYLLLVSLLVIEERLAPRAWLAALWRDRWAWLGYGVLEILALYNYYTYYYQKAPKPSLGQITHYLWIALVETFVPAVLGVDPEAPLSRHAAVIVVAVLVAVAATSVTLYFRPRAWRSLAAFAVIFPVTMLPVGLNRIAQFGVSIGSEIRYQQSVQFMFWVLAAFALSTRWGGHRQSSAKLSRWRVTHLRPVLTAAGVLLIGAYGVLYVVSVNSMAKAAEPREARAYVHAFLAGVGHVRALTGRDPDLIDHEVPENIQFASVAPFNHYDQFFGMFDPRLRIDQIADPAYFVTNSGRLLPVRFTASAAGDLRTATVSAPDGSDVTPASSSDATACVPAGRAAARLRIMLSAPRTTTPQATGLPYAVRVHYQMPVRTAVTLLLASPQGIVVDGAFPHVWGPGKGGELAPISVKTPVDEVDFELPSGACVTDLTFGFFSPAGPPGSVRTKGLHR